MGFKEIPIFLILLLNVVKNFVDVRFVAADQVAVNNSTREPKRHSTFMIGNR